MDEAIKAGRRNSESDYQRMRKAYRLAEEILATLREMGYTDFDGDTEEESGMKMHGLELGKLHEMVCDAVEEALMEMALIEPDDDMGEDAEPMRSVMDDYGKGYDEDDEDEDDLRVKVYENYAVACIADGADWKIPYTVQDGEVILGAPRTWQRVQQVWAPIESSAVKMLDDGSIVAQAIRFGSPNDPDISAYRDYFTKATDFWLDQWERRPMLYHHAQDEATADAPVIGTWVKAWVDDSGVWLQGQLDKAHKYAEAIKDMARRGLLKISTDSAPHLIKRRPGPNGTNEVQRWPLVAASLTPTPAEPRLAPVSVKSASIDSAGPGTAGSERRDGAEAAAVERERLKLEAELLMENL